VWDREDDVKVSQRNQIAGSAGDPLVALLPLALGAVAVAAGVVGEAEILAASGAMVAMAAKGKKSAQGPALAIDSSPATLDKTQAAYLAAFAKAKFPSNDVNWQTVIDSIAYNDNPNHESWMPAFQETTTRYTAFYEKFTSTPGLDLAAAAGRMDARFSVEGGWLGQGSRPQHGVFRQCGAAAVSCHEPLSVPRGRAFPR